LSFNYVTEKLYFDNITQLIGNTPLLKLNSVVEKEIYAKLEYYNPTFSIKDRAAFYMLKKAIEENSLKEGDTIIAATSGNTGLGLCFSANFFKMNYICVTFDTVPKEKISLLKAFGANVVICDSKLDSNLEGGYLWVANKINEMIENSYLINQFTDLNNPYVHYTETGKEIWYQMDGEIDYFFSTIGTGGTITGIGKYLKEMNPNIKIIGVEPEGGIYRKVLKGENYEFKNHAVESISDNYISPNVDFNLIDEIISVSDNDSFNMCYETLRKEGLCVGTSSGCVLSGIKKYLTNKALTNKRIVTVLPDLGLKYIDTLYNSEFWKAKGFTQPEDYRIDLKIQENILEAFSKYEVRM